MTIPALNTLDSQASVTFTVEADTVYTLPFTVLGSADNMQAWYRDSEGNPQDLKFGTDLIINFDSGFGTIFLVKDLAVGSKFTVNRALRNDQDKTFKSTQLFSTPIENALDKLTILEQDNDFKKTCLRATTDETSEGTKLELPAGETRIYTALGINETGKVSLTQLRSLGVKIPATRADLGLVIPGDQFTLEDSGLINVLKANNDSHGIIKVEEDFDIDNGTVSLDTSEIQQNILTATENTETANTFSASVEPTIAPVADITTNLRINIKKQVVSNTGFPESNWRLSSSSLSSENRVQLTTIGNSLFSVDFTGYTYCSTDFGNLWIRKAKISSYCSDIMASGTRILIVTSGGRVQYTDDMGASWSTVYVPGYKYLSGIAKIGTRLVVVGSSFAGYSDNNGNSWTAATTSPSGSFQAVRAIGNRLVTAGDNGVCAYSDDYGVNWTNLNNLPGGSSSNGHYLVLLGSRLILSLGGNSHLGAVYSDDAGENWTPATTPPESGEYEQITIFNNMVIMGGHSSSAGLVAYSTDAGDSWDNIDVPYARRFDGVATIGNRIIAAGGGKVALTQKEFTVPEAINRILEQKGV